MATVKTESTTVDVNAPGYIGKNVQTQENPFLEGLKSVWTGLDLEKKMAMKAKAAQDEAEADAARKVLGTMTIATQNRISKLSSSYSPQQFETDSAAELNRLLIENKVPVEKWGTVREAVKSQIEPITKEYIHADDGTIVAFSLLNPENSRVIGSRAKGTSIQETYLSNFFQKNPLQGMKYARIVAERGQQAGDEFINALSDADTEAMVAVSKTAVQNQLRGEIALTEEQQAPLRIEAHNSARSVVTKKIRQYRLEAEKDIASGMNPEQAAAEFKAAAYEAMNSPDVMHLLAGAKIDFSKFDTEELGPLIAATENSLKTKGPFADGKYNAELNSLRFELETQAVMLGMSKEDRTRLLMGPKMQSATTALYYLNMLEPIKTRDGKSIVPDGIRRLMIEDGKRESESVNPLPKAADPATLSQLAQQFDTGTRGPLLNNTTSPLSIHRQIEIAQLLESNIDKFDDTTRAAIELRIKQHKTKFPDAWNTYTKE